MARCAVLFFQYVKSSAVSVAVWIPSSASTPQVGCVWSTTSTIREETCLFQSRRRRKVEVPCSWVPLGTLTGFWDGYRLCEINSMVWKSKRLWPIVQFFFPICPVPFSTVSVAFWTPSSVSAPQVGFMWSKASPIRKETSKFQIRRRVGVEVPCSRVPLASLTGFWDLGDQLWGLKWKRNKEISITCDQCLQQSLIANWFTSWCFVVVLSPRLNTEEGGCLSSSLVLSVCCVLHLMQDSKPSSYVRALVANFS